MVNGESIVLPPTFAAAAVENADVVESGGQSAVNVTFTDTGAEVLKSVTRQAAEAANGTRLVMRASGAIVGAPVVIEPLDGRDVSIAVPQGESAEDLRDSILGR